MGHKTNRRIISCIVHPKEYPFALLYFTGAKLFNTEMRQHAVDLGYSLNEKNLTKVEKNNLGKIVSETIVDYYNFDCERAIFDFLGIQYVSPENRTNSSVICSSQN